MELLVTKNTNIEKVTQGDEMPEKSTIDAIKFGKTVTIANIYTIVPFQKITCTIKVVEISTPLEVSGGKKKQDVTIADTSGTIRLTLWENQIGQFELHRSYKLQGVTVSEYLGKKFLSLGKQGFQIQQVDDIGDVEHLLETNSTNATVDNKQTNVCIAAVINLESYYSCSQCNAKVVPDMEDPDIGSCTKCDTLHCINHCKNEMSAYLLLRCHHSNQSFRAFGQVIKDIAQTDKEVTKRPLVKSKPFTIYHTNGQY